MKTMAGTTSQPLEVLQPKEEAKDNQAFAELELAVHTALETYSNVHRGSGHNSLVSTHLYEQARDIVLESLRLDKDKYVVIFCTPRRAELLKTQLKPGSYQSVSSQAIGLSLGVRALAVKRRALPRGAPLQSGGGTARLVAPGWVIWAHSPDKFEAGTPAIVNVIAFARALRLVTHFGNDAFQSAPTGDLAAAGILYHDELEKYSGRELLDHLRQTLIGSGVLVPTMQGARPFINLDNGASTPTFAPVWKAACQAWHASRQVQEEIIGEVRSVCANVLGAPLPAYDVIFTSNTTEAINLAAESISKQCEPGIQAVVLNTLLEHNSNELPWREGSGFSLIRLPVDDEGFVDLNELETLLRAYNQQGQFGKKRIQLMAISGASNVLGVFNNLAEISRIVHHYGARLLVDAAQMVAHRKVEIEKWGIDYLAFSGHKVYAPFGSGGLVVRKGLLHFSSDEMEVIRSSGEENVGGIAALGKALVLLQRIGLDLVQEEEQALTGQVLGGLAQIPGVKVYGINDPNSPRFSQKGGVIIFSLKDVPPGQVAKELAEQAGIGVRSGCHCAHLLIKRVLHISPVLERFQGLILTLFPKLALPGVVRVSLGIENRAEDVDTLIAVLGKIARQAQARVGRKGASRPDSTPGLPQAEMDDFIRAAAQRVYTKQPEGMEKNE